MEKKIVDAIVDKNYGINGSLIKKTKIVAKKRKLNSKNPKYYPVPESEQSNERKVLIAAIDKGMRKGKNKIVKAYAVFGED